jgi:flagellar motor switch/type III secretory pathway protein FliN
LPATAFSEGAVEASLRDVVASWSSRWLLRAPAEVSAVRMGEPERTTAAGLGLRVQKQSFDIEVAMRGKRFLLEAALNVDLSESPLREGDRRLLDALAEKIIDDLAAHLEAALKPPAGEQEKTLRVVIAAGANELVVVRATEDALVPLIKAQCSKVRETSAAPSNRLLALRQTPIVAHAHLGQAEVALADLDGLCIGDVLVLDAAVSDPIELRLADCRSVIARGRLCRSADNLSIQL